MDALGISLVVILGFLRVLGQDFPPRNVTVSEEKRLTRYLIEGYNLVGTGGRPVLDAAQSTTVTLGLGLIQMELDEKDKMLITSMWTRLAWWDAYLTWNPDDFGGIKTARLLANQVWTPDVSLINTADPESKVRNSFIVVTFNGSVRWVPHQIFKSSCSINVTNFPFDHQQCHLHFGSWTHHQAEIDLELDMPQGIDFQTFVADYKDSSEWDITQSMAVKKELPEDLDIDVHYSLLSFTLSLQRKLVFSSYILTLPCIFLACLTLVVFFLPPERPDRTGLAMALFSSFLVLLLILVEAAPPTATSIPKIGIYYCFNMVIIMLSIVLSSVVVNVHKQGEYRKRVPYWAKVLFLDGLSRVLCMYVKDPHMASRPCPTQSLQEDEASSSLVNCAQNGNVDQPQTGSCYLSYARPGASDSTSRGGQPLFERELNQTEIHIGEIRKALVRITNNMAAKARELQEKREIRDEWQHLSRILDRFFFVVYFIAIGVSLLFLFPRPPHMEHEPLM